MIQICLVFFVQLVAAGMSVSVDEVLITQVTEPRLHAEGPHWDVEKQVLYYVDIAGFALHKFEPKTGHQNAVVLNNTIGAAIPSGEGKFVIGYGTTLTTLKWDGSSDKYTLEPLFSVDTDKPGNRFNDGKADDNGNVFIGTMGEETFGEVKMDQGTLFKLSNDCQLTPVLSPVSISNGITWNTNKSLMYYIDSPTRKVDVFDYDSLRANFRNRRVFFDFEKNSVPGVPDGMTSDTDNNLWIACWGGSRVIQVSGQTGALLRSIIMPVERVTSVAFGGPALNVLYVTTMRAGLNATQLSKQPNAGAVFSITGLKAIGRPANKAACSLKTEPSQIFNTHS